MIYRLSLRHRGWNLSPWSDTPTNLCMQTDATSLANNSQLCWMLHVASVCTPCRMLLDFVACCCAKFETGQTFSYVQTDATTSNNVGSCWPTVLHPFPQGFTLHYITVPKHNNWTSMQVIAFFSFITSRLCGCPLHFIKKLWGQTSC